MFHPSKLLWLSHRKLPFQDWLPAEVVQTTAVQEGTAVVANQSLSNDLLKMLPKAVTWPGGEVIGRNNIISICIYMYIYIYTCKCISYDII